MSTSSTRFPWSSYNSAMYLSSLLVQNSQLIDQTYQTLNWPVRGPTLPASSSPLKLRRVSRCNLTAGGMVLTTSKKKKLSLPYRGILPKNKYTASIVRIGIYVRRHAGDRQGKGSQSSKLQRQYSNFVPNPSPSHTRAR